MTRATILILLVFWFIPAAAEPVHTARVTKIVDGDTLFIDPPYGDSAQIRLVGIQAPKLPLGRKGFEKWPLADEAKQMLSNLALGREIALSFGGAKQDRYRRWLAHLMRVEDGLWLQGEMLKQGLARVYSFPDNRARTDEMYALERTARASGAGIWRLPFYAIRSSSARELLGELGSFQVIEGRVRDVADVKGTIYLNFGENWRTDFTVAIRKKHRRIFAAGSIDLLTLKDRSIRVRGWLVKRNGPMINATHPEQIEIFN